MKRVIKICALCLLCVGSGLSVMAQEAEKAKKQYLPEEGDFSISIGAMPIVNFVGNMFNGTTDNKFGSIGGVSYLTNDISLMGRYMLRDEWALRVNVGLNIRDHKDRYYVQDDLEVALNPLSEEQVVDAIKSHDNSASFAVGMEYRKGSKRVQGIFGASLLYAFSQSSKSYSYGNAMTELNQSPSMANEMPGMTSIGYLSQARMLKNYSPNASHTIGLVGNIGLEWFVAPKIALGAEMNVALLYQFGSKEYRKYEGYNSLTDQVEEYTRMVSPGANEFIFNTSNIGGNLYVSFYF